MTVAFFFGDVALYVFDDNDGIVNDQARRQRNTKPW